jgi:hypothetical protein
MTFRSHYKYIPFIGSFLLLNAGDASALSYCSEPREPSCLLMLGMNRDENQLDWCRSEIEGFVKSTDRYLECLENQLVDQKSEHLKKANESIEKFNCYARGDDFCL